MQYIVIAIVLVVLCIFGASCRKQSPAQLQGRTSGEVIVESSGRYMTAESIRAQLEKISKKPPPKNLAMGAMCYKVAAPPDRADYICPNCGEKTLYASQPSSDPNAVLQSWEVIIAIARELESSRRLVQQIDKLDITLDESQFCKHCKPDIQAPKLGLVIRYGDRPEPHDVWQFSQNDLLMLKAFSEGKLKFEGTNDTECDLKRMLPRLEQLLGVKLDEDNTEERGD